MGEHRSLPDDERDAHPVLNVSRLIVWAGNGLKGSGVVLALVVQ